MGHYVFLALHEEKKSLWSVRILDHSVFILTLPFHSLHLHCRIKPSLCSVSYWCIACVLCTMSVWHSLYTESSASHCTSDKWYSSRRFGCGGVSSFNDGLQKTSTHFWGTACQTNPTGAVCVCVCMHVRGTEREYSYDLISVESRVCVGVCGWVSVWDCVDSWEFTGIATQQRTHIQTTNTHITLL